MRHSRFWQPVLAVLVIAFTAGGVLASRTAYSPFTAQAEPLDICGELQRSASLGDPAAQFELGRRYAEADQCPANPAMAFFWLDLAAWAGETRAFALREVVGEDLEGALLARIRQAGDDWKACHRARGACTQAASLQASLTIDSAAHF